MAKSTAATTENRSAAINLTAEQGSAVLAAWQGMVNLFGAQKESFNVTPDGVEVIGFSVMGQYDPEQIVKDISNHGRRLDLVKVYPWLMGETPAPFASPEECTAFTVQNYRGSVEEGSARTPKYVKEAVAAFKADHNISKRRGPKTKVIRLNDLDNLDIDVLRGINPEALAKLQATIEGVLSSATTTDNTAAVAAS